jgi:anti-anti-sigma regulatory factor
MIDGVTVLTLTNSLLSSDAMDEVQAVNSSSQSEKLVLDFQAIRHMVSGSLYPDHEPIGPLLKLQQEMKVDGRRLALCGMAPAMQEFLRITRLERVFETYPDAGAAVSCMKD